MYQSRVGTLVIITVNTFPRSDRVRDKMGSSKVWTVRGWLENNENKRDNKGKSAGVAVIVLRPLSFDAASLLAQGKTWQNPLLPFLPHVAAPVAMPVLDLRH
jgi:hypothetical protein